MAQVNITLNQEEVLQVLTGDRDNALKFLLERILNEIMKAESEDQLGAAKHERSEDRQDYRNGTRERQLVTRIGKITLQVPRHRHEPFHTFIFDNYQRSESALIATMVQMVVSGVSTRKVTQVVEELCGESVSKSMVSELCKKLDRDIREFREKSLEWVDAPFVMVDATYFKVRENNRVSSKAFMVALAVRSDGTRDVIGFNTYDSEDNYSWEHFLESLKSRGLTSVKVIISDSHRAIRHAIAKVYPDVAWQRCQVHLLRNILDATPVKYKVGLKTELREMFAAPNIEMARMKKDEIVQDYCDVAPKATSILESGFEDAMTVMNLPEYIRIVLRTTNILERLNRELKRRSDVIQVFPNAESVLRLMGSVSMQYSEQQAQRQRIFTESRYNELRETISRDYKTIAHQQLALLKAS